MKSNPNQRNRKFKKRGFRSNINPMDLSMYSAAVQKDIKLKAINGYHTQNPPEFFLGFDSVGL
jgi:hypothetical protein